MNLLLYVIAGLFFLLGALLLGLSEVLGVNLNLPLPLPGRGGRRFVSEPQRAMSAASARLWSFSPLPILVSAEVLSWGGADTWLLIPVRGNAP